MRSEARLQAQYAKEVAQCAVKDRICDAPAAQYEEERRKWFVCAGSTQTRLFSRNTFMSLQ